MNVCQPAHWLTSLLKLSYYCIFSSYGCDIFIKILETLLGCFYTSSKYCQLSCMSVIPSVGLHTSWNKANNVTSPDLVEISLWKFLETFLGCFYTSSTLNVFKYLVCLSVCSLTYFHDKIKLILWYLLVWISYLYKFFWRHYLDLSSLALNNLKYLVCLSVC